MDVNLVDRRAAVERIDCDLLVVGAGAAGLAAAVTAARAGLSVTLLEKYGFAGGGAVAGLSGTVCGMYLASEDNGRRPEQVVFGFADEFVRILEDRGGITPPAKYGLTYTRVHDPLVWRETADAMLREVGVDVIYHSLAIGLNGDLGENVEGVLAYTKGGTIDIRAEIVIDASGDADILAMAGLDTFIGEEGRVQNPTMIFRLMGVDVDQFRAEYGPDTIMPPVVSEAIMAADRDGSFDLPRKKVWLFPTVREGELLCNCTRIVGPDGRELNTLFRRDFTDAEIEGRRQARQYAAFFTRHLVGCEDSYLDDTAPQVGVRQTRQGRGTARLQNSDVVSGTKFADGIARSPWPIELHAGDRPKVEWLLDDYYEIPWGCFVPAHGEGLLFAGRCLSAEHEAVASARVTAQCFSYGQAAGMAASIAVRNRIPVRQIEGWEVRAALNQAGACLS